MTELLNLVFRFLRSFLRRDTNLLVENLALRGKLETLILAKSTARFLTTDTYLYVCVCQIEQWCCTSNSATHGFVALT